MSIVCPTKPNTHYQRLAKEIGDVGAYNYFEKNGYTQPQSAEDVDAAVEHFHADNKQEELIKESKSAPVIAEQLRKDAESIYLPTKESEYYRSRTDSELKLYRTSAILEYYKKQHGEEYKGDPDPFYGKKGTVIHRYLEILNKAIFEGKDPDYAATVEQVANELSQHEEFKNDSPTFFSVTKTQFNQLAQSARELIHSLKNMQKDIDKKGKVQMFHEISVVDKVNKRAGTIDLLALFSDGSAAVFDYKTFVSRGKGPSTDKIKWWSLQVQSYVNMLKNNYGVTKIRRSRIIPLAVNYSQKDKFTQEYVSQVKEGFRNLSVHTLKNDTKHLRPIPVEERAGLPALDNMIVKIENRLRDLSLELERAKSNSEKIRIKGNIKAMRSMHRDLLTSNDLYAVQENITKLIKRYKERLILAPHEDGYMSYKDLLEAHAETDIYVDLLDAVSDAISRVENEDNRVKLTKKARENSEDVRRLNEDIVQTLIDRNGGEGLLTSGQGITTIGKLFHGLENWQIPIFQQLNNIYTTATERARINTERQYAKMKKLDDNFSNWAKANGHSSLGKFDVLRNKKTGKLHEEYSSEFLDKFYDLTKRARSREGADKSTPLTAEEKAWLSKYFTINESAVEAAEQYLKKQLDQNVTLTKADKEQHIKTFKKYTDPRNNPQVFFQGNRSSNPMYKNFIVPSKAAEQFRSKEYEFIQKNKPVKEYYDFITEQLGEYREVLGDSVIGKNFLPVVHADIMSSIGENGITSVSNIFKAYQQKLKIREHDETMGVRGAMGQSMKQVPLLFVEPLQSEISSTQKQQIEQDVANLFERDTPSFNAEVERRIRKAQIERGYDAQSKDLTRSMMMFMAMANEHIQISNIVPQVEGLKLVMNSNRFLNKETNKKDRAVFNDMVLSVTKSMGMPTDLVQAFNGFVDRLVYKQRFDKEMFTSFEKYSSNKVISMLMNFFSAVAIGANLTLIASNYNTARWNMWMLSKENVHFGKDEWKRGLKWFAKHDDRFANAYDYVQPTTRNYLQEKVDLQSGTYISRYVRSKYMFIGHILGDDRIDAAITTAMSLRYRVDSDGKIKNPETHALINKDAPTVADAIKRDKDGFAYIPGITVEEHGKFRSKVRKIAQRTKGMTNEKQKGLIYSTMLGSMLMHLRSWMPGMATTRFGRLEYDTTLESLEQGRFAVAAGEILGNGMIPAMKEFSKILTESLSMGMYTKEMSRTVAEAKLKKFQNENQDVEGIKDLTIEQFIQMRRNKLNAVGAELRVYMAFLMLLQLVRMLDMDDEEEGSVFTYSGYRATERALLELSFWMSPNAAMDIVKSPVPLYSLISRLTKMVQNSVVQTSYIVRGKTDPHSRVGPFYYTLRTFPVANQVLDILGFFERYNKPKGVIDKVFRDDD